jgi:ferredoxin
MKAKVDSGVCIGSGNCEAACPNVFQVVDGKSQVQADPVPSEEEDCVKEAVDGCPVSAISAS